MDNYWLQAAEMFGMHYHHKNRKTRAELEKELEDIKKASDERVDHFMLERGIYILQSRVAHLEDEISVGEEDLFALDAMELADKTSSYWQVNHTLIKTRLERNKRVLVAAKAEMEEHVAKLKEYQFSISRKEVDEDIAELEIESKTEVVDNENTEGPPQPTGDTP